MHFFIFPSYNFKKEARKQTGHLLTGFFFVDGMHRRAIGYGETATVASQTYFFCLASSSQASCTSPRRKRQVSFISLLVLSKMQTLALVCILVL